MTAAVRAGVIAARDTTFADHLRSLYTKARDRADNGRLEVIHSPHLPLLIGDFAVVSVQHGGAMGFIPFSDAGTHVLPVGPRHMIALGREDQVLELAPEHAMQLNAVQAAWSLHHVFYSPKDDLDELVRDEGRRRSTRMLANS